MLIFHPSERGHPSHERPRTVNPVVELGAGVQIPVGVYGVEVHHEKSKGEVQQDQLDEGQEHYDIGGQRRAVVVKAQRVLNLLNLLLAADTMEHFLLDVAVASGTDVVVIVELRATLGTAKEHLGSEPLCPIMGLGQVGVGGEGVGQGKSLESPLLVSCALVPHSGVIFKYFWCQDISFEINQPCSPNNLAEINCNWPQPTTKIRPQLTKHPLITTQMQFQPQWKGIKNHFLDLDLFLVSLLGLDFDRASLPLDLLSPEGLPGDFFSASFLLFFDLDLLGGFLDLEMLTLSALLPLLGLDFYPSLSSFFFLLKSLSSSAVILQSCCHLRVASFQVWVSLANSWLCLSLCSSEIDSQKSLNLPFLSLSCSPQSLYFYPLSLKQALRGFLGLCCSAYFNRALIIQMQAAHCYSYLKAIIYISCN